METTNALIRKEIWHRDYNLSKRHNLHELPQQRAIFGIFGIVNEEPVNCRYIGEAADLQHEIEHLFENPEHEGLKKFMQGPWIQMVQYELTPAASPEENQHKILEWAQHYQPKIDAEGEYPGYYD